MELNPFRKLGSPGAAWTFKRNGLRIRANLLILMEPIISTDRLGSFCQ